MLSSVYSTFMLIIFLLLAGNPTKGAEPTSDVPVVLVVINHVVDNNNMYIQPIFENMHKYGLKDGQNRPHFKTVVFHNESDAIQDVCEHLHSGVVAVVDMSTPELAPLLKSACLAFGITYISLLDTSYYNYPLERNSIDVMVESSAVQMLMVVAAIAVRSNLNNIAIVYDDTFDIQNTPRRVLTNVAAQHVYIYLTNNLTEAQTHIDTIIRINIKIVFIIADRSKAQSFLTLLSKTNVQNFYPNIFVLTKDAKINCGSCNNSRVILITARTDPTSLSQFTDYMHKTGIAPGFEEDRMKVDEALAFDIAILITNAVNSLTKFQGRISNIIQPDCYNATIANDSSIEQSQELARRMSESSILGVFGPFSWNANESTIRYDITLLLSEIIFDHGTLKSKVQVANWTRSAKLELAVLSLIKSDSRKMYRVVTVVGIPPFVYKTRSNITAKHEYKGYCIELLNMVSQDMKFDYSIYDVDQIGSMDENGQWSGAIRELIDGKADIAVGPISVMAERENVIDFTVPYYDLVGLTILMKKPKFDYSLVKFLSVLDQEVWGCIIGAFFLFSILISIFDKLSPFSYQNRRAQWKGEGQEPRIFTLKEGVWFCMMSLTPQGGGETPKALSGRLIAATWWLFGFIIIATYTANLAAFLTVSRLETPIESLDDLSKQLKVQYAPMNGSTAMIYFKRMAEIEHRFYEIWKNMSLNDNLAAVERAQLAVWDYPVSDKYTKLWSTMQTSLFPENKEMAVRRVLNEDFAFISDATTNRYETLINCELWEVGEEFSRKPYALAVQDGSPLRGELSNAILKLINQRSLEDLKTTWWKMDAVECPKLEDESDGISIKNIGGVFLVIVIGSGLSLITLAFECYWYRIRPKRRKAMQNSKGRAQLSPSNSNAGQGTHNNTKDHRQGLNSAQSLDSGFNSTGFELNEHGLNGSDPGFTNAGFEQSERF